MIESSANRLTLDMLQKCVEMLRKQQIAEAEDGYYVFGESRQVFADQIKKAAARDKWYELHRLRRVVERRVSISHWGLFPCA